MDRQRVIDEAKTWLGTPFLHQAAVKGAGVGCGTLLTCVYGACEFKVPSLEEIGHFSHDWHLHTREERYLNIIKRFTIETKVPRPGDIVLFRMGYVYAHSAIVVDWPNVIHVMWKRSVEYGVIGQSPLDRKYVILSPFKDLAK